MSIKTYWHDMKYWKRGAVIGMLLYFPIISLAFYSIVYEIINDIRTGFENVSLWLFLFGFPVSLFKVVVDYLIIKLFQPNSIYSSSIQQTFLLAILAFINFIVLGLLVGYIIGKIKGE